MSVKIEVWGDYACFSRPEMKVERVSYDVMTPSAARGLIEAIYWHPGMRWVIDKIRVCAPIRFTNVRRNEVRDTVKASAIQKLMKDASGESYIAASESIQQRAAMLLRDVRYVIEAHFEMTERASPADNPGKFQDIVNRRLKRGQFYHHPYFGTREFPAHFQKCDQIPPCPGELRGVKDLGWILLDLDYSDPGDIRPKFFRAVLKDGVLSVPRFDAQEAGMILQALVKLYDDLERRGEISRPGWSKTKISHALCINTEGELLQIVPLTEETERNGTTVTVNQSFALPAPVKRSFGVLPNFLWDHSGYVLGFDNKGNPRRSAECYRAFAEHHRNLLGRINHDVAGGILNFLEKWNSESDDACGILQGVREELLTGGNLVFRVNGIYPHTVPEIAEAWQRYYDNCTGTTMQCLITGREDTIEPVHPSVKGVKDSRSSGAALVSFNADSFCSYHREQGFNAPVGKKAAFAYTAALNHLLADRENVQHIADTTVLCWADGAEPQYQQFCLAAIFSGTHTAQTIRQDDLRATVKRLAEGKPREALDISPSREFCILGLAPNAARLSVRFFFRTAFGDLMRNVNAHHERCEIVGSKYETIPLWALLRETVNTNAKEKSPSPVLAGAVARAVFSGTSYPVSMLTATVLRIRAEREITSGRAAIIKAYYMKNTDARCPEEVLTVSLNENSTNIPYAIGRLFAVYEAVQTAANPGINATVKDKYFNSVASTPAHILPILDGLCQKHLRKLDPGRRIYFDRQIGEIKNIIGEENPVRLSLPEQGSFYLGYYHQKQKRYEKKEND